LQTAVAKMRQNQHRPPRGKHRNRIQIIAQLLTIARDGVIKTHLMYSANLSYKMLSQYMQFMRRTGMLREVMSRDGGGAKVYKTTAKGLRYLELYKKVQRITGIPD
jgi:predicted transcriptional regulator